MFLCYNFLGGSMKKVRIKVKNVIIASIIFVLIIVNIGLGIFFLGLRKVDNKNTIKEIEIKDMGAYAIIDKLKDEGLIRNKLMTKIYVKLGHYTNLKAGTYDLSTSMSTREIIKKLLNNDVTKKYNINLTFIEGKNIRDYAKVIANNTNNSEEDVFNLLEDKDYIDSLIKNYWFLTDDIKKEGIYYPLEGYLHPNTYTFESKDVSVKDIFATMLNETDKILSKYKKDIETKKLNIHEFMTLASVVELEGIYPDDRKEIAGVLYNRLNHGWTLGCDATTYYAFKVDMGAGLLTYQQYNTYNPYNTRHPSVAFPIGPIGNPGEIAIEACINPKESDNFYYVADCKTGTSVFTKTEYEHIQASNKIKASGCQF